MTIAAYFIICFGIFLPADASSTASFVPADISRVSHHGNIIQIQAAPCPCFRAKTIHHWRHNNSWRRSLHSPPPSTYYYRGTHPASSLASTASNVAAGSTLVLSSMLGISFEKNISKTSGGHVITLLAAALLSNISQVISRRRCSFIFTVPTDHFLYDWCWGVFLPASLVFALLSSTSTPAPTSSVPDETTYNDATNSTMSKSTAIRSAVLGMTLPFLAGSIGSVIGCVASFSFIAMPYAREATALLAGCLCASYIGGTVNFFATAKILKENAGGGAGMGSAFGSMAAADLVVMALYFTMLSAASQSTWLHRLFPSKAKDDNEMNSENNAMDDYESTNIDPTTKTSTWPTITAATLASSMALVSVIAATRLEHRVINSFPPPFNPPGTMCAFLAVFGLLFERCIGRLLSCKRSSPTNATSIPSVISSHVARSLQKIPEISPTMSNICFYLLFASVGATADLSSAVAGGPSALVFASLALIVHSMTVMIVTLTGVNLGKHLGAFIKSKLGINKKLWWPRSSWEEVLTASNAAIGGPSTAAAFAAGLIPRGDDKTAGRSSIDRGQYRSALVIGATFWGVFGYAIATGVGVTISKILLH